MTRPYVYNYERNLHPPELQHQRQERDKKELILWYRHHSDRRHEI